MSVWNSIIIFLILGLCFKYAPGQTYNSGAPQHRYGATGRQRTEADSSSSPAIEGRTLGPIIGSLLGGGVGGGGSLLGGGLPGRLFGGLIGNLLGGFAGNTYRPPITGYGFAGYPSYPAVSLPAYQGFGGPGFPVYAGGYGGFYG